MVSGDIQSYKSNTKGYYPVHSTTNTATSNLAAVKRFSDSSLRPWPPMYRSTSTAARSQMATYQPMNSHSPPAKLNYNNFSGNNIGYHNSIYGRAAAAAAATATTNKFDLHKFNMVAAAAAIDGKYASAMNLANMKNAKNHYLMSQSQYVDNSIGMPSPPTSNGSTGSFYGRTANDERPNNGNMLVMMPDKDKNRFRRLRNPTQLSPPFRSSCATCVRSKSMEDVRTEIITDWPTYNKENYIEFKRNRLNNGGPLGLLKHDVRRSMDNLLEVETTNFGKRFQVGYISIIINYSFNFRTNI